MGFTLGQVVTTRGVALVFKKHQLFHGFINRSLQRHRSLDWGDTSEEDKICNDYAVEEGSRIISVYHLPTSLGQLAGHDRIWIITEAVGNTGTRASTCILFPSEY